MALASDLMGLGVSPLIAARTATGGIGPVTITAVTGASTYASGAKIGCTQFLVTASPASGASVSLPPIGGDAGALITDDFIVNNQGAGTLVIRVSTSVLISMNGALTSLASVATHTTATLYPVSATYTAGLANWIGVSGS